MSDRVRNTDPTNKLERTRGSAVNFKVTAMLPRLGRDSEMYCTEGLHCQRGKDWQMDSKSQTLLFNL
jgi:hypothetical protein